MSGRVTAGDVVLWCARVVCGVPGDDLPDVGSAPIDDVVSALDRHRLWPAFARHGHLLPGSDELLDRAQAELQLSYARELRANADLEVIAGALQQADIPWAVVKGPVLAAVHQRAGSSRVSQDLDLLVAPSRFPQAVQVIATCGQGMVNRNFELLRRELPAEVALLGRFGTLVDLHWNLVHRSAHRARNPVPTEQLLHDVVQDAAPWHRGLHPDDALAHVCLHAAAGGGGRLSWLVDVTLSVRDRPVGWERIIARSREWGADVGTGLVLLRARQLLGAPVPLDVVRELVPPAWRTTQRLLDASPLGPAGAQRRTQAAAMSAALDGVGPWTAMAEGMRRRARRGGRSAAEFVQSSDDPGSALHAAGTSKDLDAYLSAVAAQ